MARTVNFKGNPLELRGKEVRVGETFPPLRVVGTDMQDVTAQSFVGKVLVVASVPSIDTPVCQNETRRFNTDAAALSADVEVLFVSLDLPFAQKRWCGAEGLERVRTASDYKYRSFGESTGTYIEPLGLLSRAVFVVDKGGVVRYVQYVPEVASEPDYESALAVARELTAA